MTLTAPAGNGRIRDRRDRNYRRRPGLRIRTLEEAAEFIDSVGFAVPFPQEGIDLPSLWEAHVGRAGAPAGWNAEMETVWEWKDELPANRWAYYGSYFRSKPSLISLEMLAPLLALADPPDFQELYGSGRLPHEALPIYEALSEHRPAARKALRSTAGMTGKAGNTRFRKGMAALERSLLVARVGVAQEGPGGWPSTVYNLLSEAFAEAWEQARRISPEAAHQALASRYLATVVEAHESKIARLFGWKVATVRTTLGHLGTKVRRHDGAGRWVWQD